MPGLQSDKLHWRKTETKQGTKYECRAVIYIFGEGVAGDPFDENYHGNFVRGVGYTKEAALKDAEKNFNSIHEGLW